LPEELAGELARAWTAVLLAERKESAALEAGAQQNQPLTSKRVRKASCAQRKA